MPVVARPQARVCGLSLAGLWVRIPHGAWISVSCECCIVRYRADQLFRGVLSNVGCVTECVHEASTVGRPWSTRGCCNIEKKK
jgi:hypothetical protein